MISNHVITVYSLKFINVIILSGATGNYIYRSNYLYSSLNLVLPGIEQLGSFEWVNSVPEVQVTLLLPLLRASESEQVTSTTVPETTGNCVSVCIVLSHSAFSPVQPTVDIPYQFAMNWLICYINMLWYNYNRYFDGSCCSVNQFCFLVLNPGLRLTSSINYKAQCTLHNYL